MRPFFLKATLGLAIFCFQISFSEESSRRMVAKNSAVNDSVKRISVTATSEPSTFVNHVNVIFGNLLFASQDLAVPGPMPLNLIRYYNSENNEYDWIPGTGMSTNYPHWIRGLSRPDEQFQEKDLLVDFPETAQNSFSTNNKPPLALGNDPLANCPEVAQISPRTNSNTPLALKKDHRHNRDKYAYALAAFEGGCVVRCAAEFEEDKRDFHFYIDPETIHKGLTNAGGGEISARTNMKNISFHTKGKRKDKEGFVYKLAWRVDLADGSRRIYDKNKDFFNVMDLKQDEKTNGNKLMFEYVHKHKTKNSLDKIRATNHSHAHDLGHLKVHYLPKKKGVRVRATNGKKVVYTCFRKKTKATDGSSRFLRSVESSDLPMTKYKYAWADDAFLICRIERPDGRFLRIRYDKEKRVVAQWAPVGHNNAPFKIFAFEYHPSDYYTKVLDANQNKTVYHYSSRKRLKRVHRYNAHDKLLRIERFFWGEQEYVRPGKKEITDEGHLLGSSIENSKGAKSCTQYTYDDDGNITQEKIYGNLTGKISGVFSISEDGKPAKDVESYSKYYSYSHDRFHLCEKRSEDHGPTIEYEYQKDTDLVTGKFTKDGSDIRLREFYEYDTDGVLIEKIVDDGTSKDKKDLQGVTERRCTYITPVSGRVDYGVGQPEEVKEYYLEDGKERFLRKTTYSYTREGRVAKETVFDANKQERYHISYDYDPKGNVIRKKHSAGKEWVYAYDLNGNKIREELLSSGFFTEFVYDHADRLKQTIAHHQDGLLLKTLYGYDRASNKTSSTDHMGRKLRYRYDGLHRVKAIIHPQIILSNNAVVTPTERTIHNALDKPTTVVNLNGDVTTYKYTVRGEPALIRHPDGSSERYIYHKHGSMASKVDRHGVETTYEHDFLGRDILVIVGGMKTTQNIYSSFRILASVDPMGVQTSYFYDGAGRLIEKKVGDKKTTYAYDELSRLCCTRQYRSRTDYTEVRQTYDLFDRVTEESTWHSKGTLLSRKSLAYNVLDKVIEEKVYSSSDVFNIKRFEYNSQGLPTKQIDALGNVTTFSYDYTHRNELPQTVLKKTTIDPLGMKTEEIYDAYDRIASSTQYSPQGVLLSKTTYRYDGVGNKTQQKSFVCVDGAVIRESTVEWIYNSTRSVLKCIEEPGTPEEKVTTYTYIRGDLVKEIIKPNGVVLTHSYDDLGRLSELISSDNTVHYTYAYDLNDNLTQVWDHYRAHVHTRKYDPYNRMTEDCIGDGSTSCFSYDALDRITSYAFGSGQSVAYKYRSGRLDHIVRKDGASKLYRHIYEGFDLEGRVTKSIAIGSCGAINYSYDPLGRLSSMTSPCFDLFLKQFDAVGNLLEMSFKDPLGEVTNSYSYDGLYQLVEERGIFNTSFKNDSLSNRLRKDDQAYSINSLNQLTSDSENTFSYDKNGNPTSVFIHGITYVLSYDGLDRLIALERPQVSRTEYEYDSWHRRIQKKNFSWENGAWAQKKQIRFLFFNQREVGSIDESGNVVEFRVLGLGKGAELGASVALELNQHVYAPIHDHRGNICVLVDTSNNAASATYRYSAYGEEELTGSVTSPWRFASKRFDPESGLIFFGRRYYAPTVGRFLTPDPIGFTDGPNLYAYVHNCPLILIDPYGLLTMEDAKEGAVGGVRGFGTGAVNGFVHPFDTVIKYGDYARSAGMMAYQRDFSSISASWNRSSMADIAEGSTRVVGEVLGAGAALIPGYQLGKTVGQAAWRGAASLWGRFGPSAVASTRGLLGRETVQAAESAVVAEAETASKSILTRTKIKDYLSNAESVKKNQLITDLESIGLQRKGKNDQARFVEFIDKTRNVRAKIHPPDKITQYDHLHIYDRAGNPLNKDLEIVCRTSQEAHIPYGGNQ
jgi:RHS repeat-associated protein